MLRRHTQRRRLPLPRGLLLAAGLLVAAGCGNGGAKDGVPADGRPPAAAGGDGELRQQVDFDGEYIDGLRLEGEWSPGGPAGQVAVTFVAEGLADVKQVEFLVSASPAAAFDLASASFVPESPFITLPGGVQREADGSLRMVGASLAETVSGTRVLGTLTVTTSPAHSATRPAQLRIVRVSVGPTSTQRDTYEGGDLRLGVEVR